MVRAQPSIHCLNFLPTPKNNLSVLCCALIIHPSTRFITSKQAKKRIEDAFAVADDEEEEDRHDGADAPPARHVAARAVAPGGGPGDAAAGEDEDQDAPRQARAAVARGEGALLHAPPARVLIKPLPDRRRPSATSTSCLLAFVACLLGWLIGSLHCMQRAQPIVFVRVA